MQRMAEEIKELQAGLGAVVQALNFLQTFIESDYGLKFQFHAYRNSPLFSANSETLEILKQKYSGSNDLQETCFNGNERLFQEQHASTEGAVNNAALLHLRYPNQDEVQVLGQSSISTVGSLCQPNLNQSYVNSSEQITGGLSPSHGHGRGSSSVSVPESLSAQGSPIIVSEEELFGASSGITTMKEESHDMYHDETGIGAFNNPEMGADTDNDSDGEITIRSNSIILSQDITKKSESKTTPKRGRTKKEKINENYKCPHCRRRCPDRAKLELHMTHHKQQFQCKECGIWLADKSVLNRHMRTHTGDRPFKCTFCPDSFSRQDIFKKHIQRKHKGMVADPKNCSSNVNKNN